MENVKATIKIGEAFIELEGPSQFVEKYLDKYDTVISQAHTEAKVRVPEQREIQGQEEGDKKRKRMSKPKTGASCSGRIRDLIQEGYFAEPRTSTEVMTYLKDQKATTYQLNQVSASLSSLLKVGNLRRILEGKTYKFCNP